MATTTTDGKTVLPKGASVTAQRGKWIGRVRLPNGQHPGFTLGASEGPGKLSQDKAVEKLAAWLEAGLVAQLMAKQAPTAAEQASAAKPTTIGDIVAKWVPLVRTSPKIKPATRAGHVSNAEGEILRTFGAMVPSELDTPAVKKWIREMRVKRSASRTRNLYFTLHKMMRAAKSEKWIASLPWENDDATEELPALKVTETADRARHEIAQARSIIAATPDAARRVCYLVAFTTGMRIGEIAGLRWRDVVTEQGHTVYRVREALAMYGDAGTMTRTTPKTAAGKRDVPVHPFVAAALATWKAEGWQAYVGRKPSDDDPLFPDVDGKPHRGKSAELFREDLGRAGLPMRHGSTLFKFHSTRASFVTWLLSAGAPRVVVKQIVGHSESDPLGRHYTGDDYAVMLRWISIVDLGPAVQHPVQHEGGDGGPSAEILSSSEDLSEVRTGFEPAYNGFASQVDDLGNPRFPAKPTVEDAGTPPKATRNPALAGPLYGVGTDPLDVTIASLASAIGAAAAAGDLPTLASLSATIGKLTDELRARRLDSAGVVSLDTKRAR